MCSLMRLAGTFVFIAGIFASANLRADEPTPASAKLTNAKARAEAASKVYRGTLERWKVDPNTQLDPEKLYQWSRRWMEAEQDLSDKKEDRTAAAEAHLERMKKLETLFKQYFEKKLITPAEVAAQTFFRLDAERTLAQIKGE